MAKNIYSFYPFDIGNFRTTNGGFSIAGVEVFFGAKGVCRGNFNRINYHLYRLYRTGTPFKKDVHV